MIKLFIIFSLMVLLSMQFCPETKNKKNYSLDEKTRSGWYKSESNPLFIFEGELEKAPKNILNSPVIVSIDNCPYKDYKWAFFHISTDPETYQNYLSIKFATQKGFKVDQWEHELKITGKLVEPFDALIIDGRIYLWGVWPMRHEHDRKLFVMTSGNWENWSEPEISINNDQSWKNRWLRGFTVGKVFGEDKYIVMFSGQGENGAYSTGRATASTKQIKDNQWEEDTDNPVFTSKDISWSSSDVVLYPRLLPQCSNGRWMMAMGTYLKERNRFSIGFVYSDDMGKNWKEYLPGKNPVLHPGPEAWDAGYISTPYIFETGVRSYKMYYGARPEIMKYHAIGVAYLGQQNENDEYAVAINRQISWENCRLQNMEIQNICPYDNDMNDELTQIDIEKNCEILIPVVDLGVGRNLIVGRNATRLYANSISGVKIEIRGSNQPPTEDSQSEWRKGYTWYKDWGKTSPSDFKKYALRRGGQQDEFYISGSCPYRFVQMKISTSTRANPLIIDQILLYNE